MAVHVRAPLLDRLAGVSSASSGAARATHTLTREGLKESVRRELETLLNTRSALPASVLLTRELTVIDYGLPDLADFSAANHEDHSRLAAVVERVITAFEPRLSAVQVRVEGYSAVERGLSLQVEATLNVDGWREPVSFPTVLGVKSGASQVGEARS
ncbi:MAG TPA: type VI secretion system baseplate subunit TssE [Thermoanaerobaculia bacterium]|nr:type VI secretion system baseplate subunit TssE [Thermoanaerobaculia bacterium]